MREKTKKTIITSQYLPRQQSAASCFHITGNSTVHDSMVRCILLRRCSARWSSSESNRKTGNHRDPSANVRSGSNPALAQPPFPCRPRISNFSAFPSPPHRRLSGHRRQTPRRRSRPGRRWPWRRRLRGEGVGGRRIRVSMGAVGDATERLRAEVFLQAPDMGS